MDRARMGFESRISILGVDGDHAPSLGKGDPAGRSGECSRGSLHVDAKCDGEQDSHFAARRPTAAKRRATPILTSTFPRAQNRRRAWGHEL